MTLTIAPQGKKIYRVAELTALIKAILENEFGSVWLEGEISNLRRPSSGHLYFTLKDELAQIKAVLFRGNQQRLSISLSDGLKVRVQGEITVYEKGGEYQIIVRVVEEAGKGSLQEAFEALKKKLSSEGLFDEARKKPIPMLPQRIGLVTSPSGAALRDILNVLTRRYPNLHLIIAPCRVQGEGAAQEIAEAIDLLNVLDNCDVMIVGRGGGSIEDLWCFNEEIVARAIARSHIPIISAVGHEIDFTISDFVADLRAPTPSAAAELVVGQKDNFETRLKQIIHRLTSAIETQRLRLRNRLTSAEKSYVFREPTNILLRYRQLIDSLQTKMGHALLNRYNQRQQRLDELNLRLTHRIGIFHDARTRDIERLTSQLRALNPLAVLDRGYSLTRLPDGTIIRSADQISVGNQITTQVAKGSFESTVSCVSLAQ